MKLKTHHIALKVHDLKQCEDFYVGVLGLPVMKHQLGRNGNIRAVWLDLEGVILMLERCEGERQSDPAAITESMECGQEPRGRHLLALCIPLSARASWKEKLEREGVTIFRESDYSIYFRDPENNNLALSHYPEPVAR